MTNSTYLTASLHLCINAWSWHEHVHGIQTKQNPNNHQRNRVNKTKQSKNKGTET